MLIGFLIPLLPEGNAVNLSEESLIVRMKSSIVIPDAGGDPESILNKLRILTWIPYKSDVLQPPLNFRVLASDFTE